MKLLVQPNDGATALLKAIHRAQAQVKIAIFRFDHPPLEEALTTAVKRGVSVHALIAHVNGTGAEALRKLEMRLLAAGVTVARTDTTFLRYHSKYVIIDQRELFVLAYNFTRQDIEKSRSFGLVTKNRRLAQEATKLFEADAKRQPYEVGCSNLIVSPLNARKQLASFIKGAKNELAIYDPRVSDRTILRLLRERADANVSVRIIGWASGRQNTIAVQQLTDIRLHARCIIRDRKAVFIGSQSLRELELDSRRELGMICRARSIVTALRKTFEEDWTRCAQSPIPPDTTRPISKAAKKVAKAIATDLPLIGPALENAAKDVAQNGAKIKWDGGEVEQTVRAAVKEAVKTAVEHVMQETITGEPQSRE